MMPKISVIIPIKDEGSDITRALQSVVDQTYPPHEIVVIDGHSLDDGPERVRNFGDERILLIEQKGTGVSRARNQGIAVATGDFIAFLDADDEWFPDHLDTITRLIKTYPEAKMFANNRCRKYADGTTELLNTILPPPPWEGIISDFLTSFTYGDPPIPTSFTVVEREACLECQGFPEWASFNEDHALWIKLGIRYPTAYSSKIGGIQHLTHPNWIFERYPFSAEIASGKVLAEELKEGKIPEAKIKKAKTYIGKTRMYALKRNFWLLILTLRLVFRDFGPCVRFTFGYYTHRIRNFLKRKNYS